MEFSIIFSIDCPRDVSIGQFNPPKKQRHLWELTEDDRQYEYGYLEGAWRNGKHRKWCAILDRQQFEEFLDHTGLFAEDVATMGSIGAPGCGYGWAPAFSFRNDDPDAILSAYVTPLASAAEMGRFVQAVNEEYDIELPVPALLTDTQEQGHLFDGVVQSESETAERSIRRAICTLWGN
jgi:hypothetical protein